MARFNQVCMLAALLAMIWAGLRPGRQSGIIVQDVELGAVRLHEPLWVDVTVMSGSSQPIRLLGVTSSCNPAGCVLESDFPDTIEPFGTAVMRVQFRPEQNGRFERRVEFFADGTPHYRNEFMIRGSGHTEETVQPRENRF